MTKRLIFFGLLLIISSPLAAQTASKDKVTFDPSFWNSRLRLSHSQLRKIDDINYRFYQSLKETTLQDRSKKSYARELEKALQTRNENIEQLFMPRQKRRWTKIARDLISASHHTTDSRTLPQSAF